MQPADIISNIVAGMTGLVTSLGQALQDSFTSIFLTTSGNTTSISTLGVFLLVFLGVGIALALFTWIKTLISKRG